VVERRPWRTRLRREVLRSVQTVCRLNRRRRNWPHGLQERKGGEAEPRNSGYPGVGEVARTY